MFFSLTGKISYEWHAPTAEAYRHQGAELFCISCYGWIVSESKATHGAANMILGMDTNQAISISALQHYIYCPRQCGLIHVAQVWSENLHTQKGRREHDRVDVPEYEIKAGMRIDRALPVWSETLKLTGKCDVVEFHDGGLVYPVEYKHGPRKKGLHDDVQLCAQAMCLEEMLNVSIAEGAIYHVKSRRRRKVLIDDVLRKRVRETLLAVRDMIDGQSIPDPVLGRYCEQCSLQEICMPAAKEAQANLFEPLPDDLCVKF